MSCLDEKIITNCGSVEKRYGKKPEYLRYSAAHSTLVVDNTNISELSKNSYKRIPKKLLFNHEENDEDVIGIAKTCNFLQSCCHRADTFGMQI